MYLTNSIIPFNLINISLVWMHITNLSIISKKNSSNSVHFSSTIQTNLTAYLIQSSFSSQWNHLVTRVHHSGSNLSMKWPFTQRNIRCKYYTISIILEYLYYFTKMLQNYPISTKLLLCFRQLFLHELLGSGMTFKQWLKHTINPTSDADLVRC